MSTEEKALTIMPKDTSRLDAIAGIQGEYAEAMAIAPNGLIRMAATANAIARLRSMLPDDVVGYFMPLQNTRIGFKTDRKEGYPVPVVRECLIEALLHGLQPIGNEFNIIADGMYTTKEGFTGKMHRNGRFSKLRLRFGIPAIQRDEKRAIVSCGATWLFDGVPDSIECEIPVKIDVYKNRSGDTITTMDDAILGKAERKLRCRIWNQATGDTLTDGEAIDATAEVVTDQMEQKALSAADDIRQRLEAKQQQIAAAEEPTDEPDPDTKAALAAAIEAATTPTQVADVADRIDDSGLPKEDIDELMLLAVNRNDAIKGE